MFTGRSGPPGGRWGSRWGCHAASAAARDTIPSGQTVTGAIEWDSESSVSGDFRTSIALPARAPQDLSDSTVNFAADLRADTTDDDAACTGTATAPTAPAGKVCIYLINAAANTSGLSGRETLDGPRSAFTVTWGHANTSGSDVFVYATWAYTAP